MDTKTEMEEAVATIVEPEPSNLTKAEKNKLVVHNRIKAVEDDIFDKAMNVVSDTLDFAQIHPGVGPDASEEAKAAVEAHNGALVERWAAEMGSHAAAAQRFRIAQQGWATAGQMPGGIKLAQETFVGIAKARAKDVTVQIGELKAIVMMPQSATANRLLEGSDE